MWNGEDSLLAGDRPVTTGGGPSRPTVSKRAANTGLGCGHHWRRSVDKRFEVGDPDFVSGLEAEGRVTSPLSSRWRPCFCCFFRFIFDEQVEKWNSGSISMEADSGKPVGNPRGGGSGDTVVRKGQTKRKGEQRKENHRRRVF